MLAPNPLTDDISPVRAQDTRRRRSIKLALGVCCVLLLSAGVVGWLSESAVAWRQDMIVMAAVLIFVSTYAVIAIGKLPGFHLDRAGAALLGASLMAATGLLSLDDAYRAIDVDTIALLLGMMIVVANVRLSGFFRLVNNWMTMRARHPLLLLAAVTLVSGFFSAFLVNDAICLVVAPLVLDCVTRLRRNPVPYLLAVAMASNVGSTATITGNPQNILIGSFSQIPYAAFSAALWPVAAAGLVLTVLLIAVFFPGEFWTRERLRGAAGIRARASATDDEIPRGRAGDGDRIFRRSASGEGGADCRLSPAHHPKGQVRKSVSANRLALAAHVHGPLRRGGGI